jgi:hypothetical protein
VMVEAAPSTITLCGYLLDAESRQPLPYAPVLGPRGRNTQSGEDGRFSLQIPADVSASDTLTLRYIGFQPRRLMVREVLGRDCPAIYLAPASNQLMEIIVTDRAVDPYMLSNNGEAKSEVRTDRVGFVPGLGEPDPFRMMQFLPGVNAEGDRAGELLVRGGSKDQNLILWEDIPIYHTGHLFGVVSALNPYVVNRVNIWKGNFGADQGGRASSIIDMRSDQTGLEKPVISAGVNLVSSYFAFETPLFRKKAGLLLAGRGAYSDILTNSFYQKLFGYATQGSRISNDFQTKQSDSLLRSVLLQPISEFSDANLKFFYQISEKTRVEVSGYSGTDILRYRVDARVPQWNFYYKSGDTVQQANVGFNLKLRQRWSADYQSSWQVAWSGFDSRYRYGGSQDTLVFPQTIQNQDNTLREAVFRFDNSWRIAPHSELRFGVQSIKTANRFRQLFINTTDTAASESWELDIPSNQSAIYGIWHLRQGPWNVEGGIRHTTFNRTFGSYWEPRFSMQWEPWPGVAFKANGGVFHQFMRTAYVWNQLGLNNEAWFTADEDIQQPVLRNTQMAVGASFRYKGWVIDLESYRKYLSPLTGTNLRFNGIPQVNYTAVGSEYANGFEFLLRKRWGVYTHWLSYTLSRSLAQFDSINGGNPFPTDFDQTGTLNWAHQFEWRRWSLSVAFNIHTGRPYTPPKGIRTFTDANGVVQREVEYGLRNSARLPNHWRMDVSAQYRFSVGRLRASSGLSVFNFTNHLNLESRTFFVETTTDANGQTQYSVGALNRVLLGRIVNIFVLLRF